MLIVPLNLLDYQDSSFLGCDTVMLGVSLCLKGCNAFETLGTTHPVTWLHMPENFNSQLHQYRNLKTQM